MTPEALAKLLASKGVSPEHLKNIGASNLALQEKMTELARNVEEQSEVKQWLNKFVTVHSQMLKLKEKITKLASVDDRIMIIGESGTGKELIARALHGGRKEQREEFVDVNCAGMPENLIESELFGHVKGAFTGAVTDKNGLMAVANFGTLFLDEIGELPLTVQAKLLRAIEEMRIRPVGGTKYIDINCRIVCATHRDIDVDIDNDKATFREDLFWRLRGPEILRPWPLRERHKDIPLIVRALDTEKKIVNLDEFCKPLYDLPLRGNVRELQQLVRRFYILGELP